MKDRIPVSDDITVILCESGCVMIYSRTDDESIVLNDEEQRALFEWLKQHLEWNSAGFGDVK